MVKLYIESMKLKLKSQLEYRLSFILTFISQIGVFFTYYFMTVALFQRFDNIKGFTLYEVLLCFSIIHFGFAFNETFFRGVDKFDKFIIDGSLDRLLVRPRGVLYQVICSEMDFVKVARIIQSLILFFGIFLLMASYCFITIHGLEVRNLLTDGGKQMAQYPIGIFRKGFIFIFTFIIPYASVNYYPLLYLLGKSNNTLYLLSPLLIVVYLIPCFLSFKIGLKHYSSTGS